MSKTKRNKLLVYLGLVIAIVLIAMIIFRKNYDEEIMVSEPVWQCDYFDGIWRCEVSFFVKNNTHHHLVGNIGVRGINLQKKKGSRLDELSNVVYVPYSLQEYEGKDFQGIEIEAKLKPTRVNLTIINKETTY
jgi:hypothetical protein